MYGYEKYPSGNISEEDVLSRTTEEDVFKIVIQDEIILDKGATYKAPYRSDNNGDCYFEEYKGMLMFVDFALPGNNKNLNWLSFIMKCYNINALEALELINNKLELGIGDNNYEESIPEIRQSRREVCQKKFKKRVITILPRDFNYKDKQFWSKYEISRQNLEEDGVIPITLYRSTSKTGKYFTVKPFDICYAYTEFSDSRKKIYRPETNLPKAKWFTTCNQNDIGSIKHLPKKGDLLVITKSYKDCRVLRNQGLNVIWFQNEGQIPKDELLINLLKRFKKIVIWFDNDSAGITNSKIVADKLKSLSTNNIIYSVMLPPKLLTINIKDPSDYIDKRGKEELLEFINLKVL